MQHGTGLFGRALPEHGVHARRHELRRRGPHPDLQPRWPRLHPVGLSHDDLVQRRYVHALDVHPRGHGLSNGAVQPRL